MSNDHVNWDCKIQIPRLPCLFRMAKSCSTTIDIVNCDSSDSVNSFNFAMCASASKCFHIELVSLPDGWRRTWWETICMMPGLLVSASPQWKLNCHQGASLELFQAIESFESTFRDVHQASNMIWRVRSYKSGVKTHSCLDDTITSNKELFLDFESDMVLGIWSLCQFSWMTVKNNDMVK